MMSEEKETSVKALGFCIWIGGFVWLFSLDWKLALALFVIRLGKNLMED